MQDKKLTIKRIVVFTFLAYLPMFLFGAFCIKGEGKELEITSLTFGTMTMMFPTIAHILTRLTTKEGFHNIYMGTGKKGSGKYYFAAIIYPLIVCIAGGLLIGIFMLKDWSFSEALGSDGHYAVYLLTTGFVTSITTLVSGFGEEFGWRAYLTPKLEELMPTSAAVIVTGIIWSFWHAPLIVRGYNFGTDYSFYPYGGLIAMMLFCIFTAAILTWMTKKTGSVYPAAICHAFIDGLNVSCLAMFRLKAPEEPFEPKYSNFAANCVFFIPTVLLGITAFILMRSKKNADANPSL